MAYQYQAAIARAKTLDGEWSSIDASQMTLNALLTNYAKVYVTLTNPVIVGPVYLDMDQARALIPPSNIPVTLTAWLASLGNRTLPTISALPDFQNVPALYTDAWHSGFDIRPVKIGVSPTIPLPAGACDDLLMSKTGQDFSQVWKYALVTVNGLFHRIGGAPEGIYVVDGAKSGRVANDNNISIYSFTNVADLEIIPITPEMIYKTNPNEQYGQFAHVKLPHTIDNQTLLLVIGGYLHVLDDSIYKQVGTQSVKIDFSNYPLPERIFEMQRLMDISGLNLTPAPNNASQFAIEDLYSDQTIVNLLTLSQSFFVVVNTPAFYMRKLYLEQTKIPGRYIGNSPLQYPLIGGVGRVHDYYLQPEWGQYVYGCKRCDDIQYNFRTQPWEQATSVDPTRSTIHPFRLSNAFLLEMGKYL